MPIHWESRSEPIPGYRLLERLGRGGFGEVWKAQAPGGLFKAIKFVYGSLTASGGSGEHAQQELRALSRIRNIRHPFVLSVERFDIIDGQLMIVMELADRNLDERLRECQQQGLPGIPRAELLLYMSEAADALDVMNSRYDLQHLDIKPRNIFLVGEHIKIGDFGLVKDLEGVTAEVTGGITPVYAAPETFDGWISRFCDQYALAIVYQELLTGQRPFNGQSARQLMMQHLTMTPDVSPLPAADQDAVLKALAKDPKDRYPTCRAFVADLLDVEASGAKPGGATLTAPTAEVAGAGRAGATSVPGPGSQYDVATTRLAPFEQAEPQSAEDTRRLAGVLRRVPIDPDPEGLLAPTLVIGLGGSAQICLQALRRRLCEQFGTVERWPLVRLLALDVDPEAFPEFDESDPGCLPVDDRLVCRLKRPAHYLREWKNLGHLSEWLGPNYVFQIPAAGGTNGHRPLGRLAFFENYPAIVHAVRSRIESLLAPSNIAAAVSATGRLLRSKAPRLMVLTALGGGTGGMFFDLCYLARKLLLELEQSTPDVGGVLLTGVAGNARTERLQRFNHLAFAEELQVLMAGATGFRARYEPTAEADDFRGPPLASAYLFGCPDPVAAESEAGRVAEFLYQTAAGPVGKGLDEQAPPAAPPPFRAVGAFSIEYPRELLLRHTAQRCSTELATRWSSPLPPQAAIATQKAAETLLAASGFDSASIADRLLQDWNGRLPDPLHVLAAQRLARLEETIAATPADRWGEQVRAALAELQALLGGDSADAARSGKDEPLMVRVSRSSVEAVSAGVAPALAEVLRQALDAPGHRLDTFHRTWVGVSQFLFQSAHQQQEMARGEQQLGARAARGLRDVLDQLEAPRGRRHEPAMLLGVCERWAQNKIEQHLRMQVAQVYFALRGKLLEKYGLLPDLRRRLAELESVTNAAPPAPAPGCQWLFPGGLRNLADAVERLFGTISTEQLDELDHEIGNSTFRSYGGFAALASEDESVLPELGATMVAQIMSWLEPLAPRSDAAEVFLSRHRANPDAQIAELRAYFDWAASPIELAATDRLDAPVAERCLVTAPASAAGQQFYSLARAALSEADPAYQPDEQQCALWRVRLHPALAAFLPAASEETQAAFSAACQGNQSPKVFRTSRHQTSLASEAPAPG